MFLSMTEDAISKAADLIKGSDHTIAFTGAGISVESGIAPFRGEGGLWSIYDPMYFDLGYFYENPGKSWEVIKEIFFEKFEGARPNEAHQALADLQKKGFLKEIITQNIDNLHQLAGSNNVVEFHGNCRRLVSIDHKYSYPAEDISLDRLPPRCPRSGNILKPDFIFFGEEIPPDAYMRSMRAAENAKVVLVIGTTGEVMPAGQVPVLAKQSGAKIIEVNTSPSHFTQSMTDIFLEGKATEVMGALVEKL
jgi:NAD-dependent deacetylase